MTSDDIRVLRALAAEYMEIAISPEMGEKRRLWRALNACRAERPMVLVDQLPWNEFDINCAIEDPYWRAVEQGMRRKIYQYRRMPADMVFTPYVCLGRPIHSTGYGIEAEVERLPYDEGGIAAQAMTNQIRGPEDLTRLREPVITLDAAREAEIIDEAERAFGGVAPFRMTGIVPHLGIWDTITYWMGVTNCYIELLDRPEMIHALMEKLTRCMISEIEQMNALKLFDVYSNSCHCSQTLSDDLPSGDGVEAISQNAWAFGMAQLFSSVSPAITEEFEARYMRRIFPYFGGVYYGCCDRLDDRMDVVDTLPKVRKVSCSPWSDRDVFAEKLPKARVMSAKPSPAFLAGDAFDEDGIRADLRHTISAARDNGLSLELILKDISTVGFDISRPERWVEIAMEEACR